MTQQTQQHNTTKNITLTDRFEFRDIHAEEADRAVARKKQIRLSGLSRSVFRRTKHVQKRA